MKRVRWKRGGRGEEQVFCVWRRGPSCGLGGHRERGNRVFRVGMAGRRLLGRSGARCRRPQKLCAPRTREVSKVAGAHRWAGR